MYENKKIMILGLAKSGNSVLKILLNKSNDLYVTDMKEPETDILNLLKDNNIEYKFGENSMEMFDKSFDLLIKTPGVPNTHPYVIFANENSIPVINEIEVGYNLLNKNKNIIAVTGSNGKTTTTTIIYEIFKAADKDIVLSGNIGTPLCDVLDQVTPDNILLLEISSHQLLNMKNFKSNISVLTNLYEAHLDVFNNDYDYYKRNKINIFNHHSSEDFAILNYDNAEVIAYTENIKSTKIYFSTKDNIDGAHVKNNKIYFFDEFIMNTNDIVLKGSHNIENILCAITVAKLYEIDNDIIASVLNTFSGVEHRVQYLGKVNDISFYNDSKATNTTSTITALNSFKDTEVTLMIGGKYTSQNFELLLPHLEFVKNIIAYGECRNIINEALSNNKNVIVCEGFEDAFNTSVLNTNKDGVLLFSPSASSFDLFNNYEHRGEVFIELFNKLKK